MESTRLAALHSGLGYYREPIGNGRQKVFETNSEESAKEVHDGQIGVCQKNYQNIPSRLKAVIASDGLNSRYWHCCFRKNFLFNYELWFKISFLKTSLPLSTFWNYTV